MQFPIGSKVTIAGTPYTGQIVATIGDQVVVELDDHHDDLPTDACWFSEDGYVLWPTLANELEAI